MKINKELLRETLQTIKANPQHWNQANWHCGTSHCFAGIVECKLRNHPLDNPVKSSWIIENVFDLKDILIANQLDDDDRLEELYDCYLGETNTSLLARIALGINESQGFKLFDEGNTLEDLKCIVEKLCTQKSNEED